MITAYHVPSSDLKKLIFICTNSFFLHIRTLRPNEGKSRQEQAARLQRSLLTTLCCSAIAGFCLSTVHNTFIFMWC